jgi:hypothetical protein
VDLHGDFPPRATTLHPGFGSPWERPGWAIREGGMVFGAPPARSSIVAPMRAPRPASLERRRHSAAASRRGCQAEEAGESRGVRPTPRGPEDCSLQKSGRWPLGSTLLMFRQIFRPAG